VSKVPRRIVARPPECARHPAAACVDHRKCAPRGRLAFARL